MEEAYTALYQEFLRLQILCVKQAEMLQQLIETLRSQHGVTLVFNSHFKDLYAELVQYRRDGLGKFSHTEDPAKATYHQMPHSSMSHSSTSQTHPHAPQKRPSTEQTHLPGAQTHPSSAQTLPQAAQTLPQAAQTHLPGAQTHLPLLHPAGDCVVSPLAGALNRLHLEPMQEKVKDVGSVSVPGPRDTEEHSILDELRQVEQRWYNNQTSKQQQYQRRPWSSSFLTSEMLSEAGGMVMSRITLNSRVCEFCHAVFPGHTTTRGEFLRHLTTHIS